MTPLFKLLTRGEGLEMRLTTLAVIGALTSLILGAGLALGRTLTVIQVRQQHEDEAIRCVLDAACLKYLRRHQNSAIHGDLV